jgi:hypothetical protein
MSIAIAPTFEANKIGVRRVYTLAGLGRPPDPSTIADLVANGGYDMGTINTLVALGATDEQLLTLPYPAGPDEMSVAVANLMNILAGAQAAPGGSAASAGSYPQSAQPTTVSTAFGVYDLTQEASWSAIAKLFTTVQQQLNEIARLAPNDPDVISHVRQFNSLVVQWAGYYTQAFGSAPSPLPMASIPGGGSMSGTLGVIPIVIAVALVAGVVALLGALYGIYTWGQNKKSQITATAQVQGQAVASSQATANTLLTQAAALIAQANALPPAQSAQAAAMRAQAAVMQQQATGLVGQSLSSTLPGVVAAPLTNWFTQNWIGVAAVLIGMAVLPGLIKKL